MNDDDMPEAPAQSQQTPKVTIRERPSDQLVRGALKETVVADARGRRIRLTRPSVLAEYKLIQVIGGEAAANQPYVSRLMPLLYVSAIDEDPVFFPAKPIEIDALIQRLDHDGVEAVFAGIVAHFRKAGPDDDRDTIKN